MKPRLVAYIMAPLQRINVLPRKRKLRHGYRRVVCRRSSWTPAILSLFRFALATSPLGGQLGALRVWRLPPTQSNGQRWSSTVELISLFAMSKISSFFFVISIFSFLFFNKINMKASDNLFSSALSLVHIGAPVFTLTSTRRVDKLNSFWENFSQRTVERTYMRTRIRAYERTFKREVFTIFSFWILVLKRSIR